MSHQHFCNHANRQVYPLRDRADIEDARSLGDRLAWEIIDARIPPERPESYRSSRPSNYAEMWEAIQAYIPGPGDADSPPWTWPAFEHAWSNFLHEFFHWRRADYFAVPPPEEMRTERVEYLVLLAGSAEYLCRRYGLELPPWIDDQKYVLPTLTDFQIIGNTPAKRAATEFLKRNLVFEARNLITL